MNLINKIEQKKINIVPYNLTFASKRKIFYPKNYSQLKLFVNGQKLCG